MDPRRTASAQWADQWLGLNVGTDIALSNAMAREIIHSGLANDTFIRRATTGFDAYRASVEPYTLELAERETGVPADVIREAAHAYARADRAEICWTLGITEHHNAVDNVLSLINLALLTGHVGKYGSGVNPLRGQNNVQGGGDMGAIPNRLVGFQDWTTDAAIRTRFERAWGVTLEPRYGRNVTQMFEGMEHGEITALYAIGENPAQAEADQHRTERPAQGPGPPRGAGHLPDPHGAVRARGASGVLELVRGGGHRDQQRAAGAADAQGARAARRRARRHLDHRRAGQAARPRLGPSVGRGHLERSPQPGADLRRHELRAPRAGGRAALALLRRASSGGAVPAQPPVAGAGRGPAGAVLGGRARPAGGAAGRRVPLPAHDRPATRLLQHRRPDRRLQLAASAGRDGRHLAGGRGADGCHERRRSSGSPRAAAASRPRPGSIGRCEPASSS